MNQNVHTEKIDEAELEKISGSIFWSVLWIHGKWKIYNQLFIEEESKKLISEVGLQPVFKILQNSLIQDIYMMLNRLLDREEQYSQKNICFELLVKIIRETNEDLADKIETNLQEIRDNTATIRNIRHKYIAHSDYKLNINLDETPIIKPKIKEINSILEKISDLMNLFIYEYEHKPKIAFNKFSMSNDGMDIVNFIKEKRQLAS